MATTTIQQAFDAASQHQRAGRLPEAEQLCRQILVQQPNHADALHLLAIVACQAGRFESGADLIRRAIALRPNWAEAQNNLGNALKDMGQRAQAIAAFRQAIALRPSFPQALCNLGNALREDGKLHEAIAVCRQAVAAGSNIPEAHYNLANCLKAAGQLDDAIAAYRRAIALRGNYPDAWCYLGASLSEKGQASDALSAYQQAIALRPTYADAHYNFANLLRDLGRADDAIAAYRNAIHIWPNFPEGLYNLGNVLKATGHLDEAIAVYRQAIALRPGFHEAFCNLGNALQSKGQLEQAISTYRRVIAQKPDFSQAHSNLGAALTDTGQLDEAAAACRQAIALSPDYPDAHINLAAALLVTGNLTDGWREYEWRWNSKDVPLIRRFPGPQWDGRPLGDGTLVLYSEQGFGDSIQFIRYLPLVSERCKNVVVACPPQLRRILQSVPGIAKWISSDQSPPAFDAHCPLMSLPLALGTTLKTVPNSVPYLHADTREIGHWQDRLADEPAGLKVGVAWAGNKAHKNDRNRSLHLSSLGPLAAVRGVNFYSLQKGDAAQQASIPPTGMTLIDWTKEFNDFADTAALIANLDLVISVDTAVVHLAGAMGKPVWLLLPFAPDWRWMLQRQDSPWYPTMRLFRQPAAGDWESVIRNVADALQALPMNPDDPGRSVRELGRKD